MAEIISPIAATRLRQRHYGFATTGRYVAHVNLAPEDSKLAKQTIDQIAELTGQRPSPAVLLRAGVAALADLAGQAKREKTKLNGEAGKIQTSLMWHLARSAKLQNGR